MKRFLSVNEMLRICKTSMRSCFFLLNTTILNC